MNLTEKTALDSIKNAFEGENIQTYYRVLGYEIHIYFHDYKLAVEIDENNHQDRDISREIERQKALENELVVNLLELILIKKILIFLRFRMKYLGTLKNQIKNQLKELTKKSLIDQRKLLNKLLKLGFEKNNSIKTKCFKHVAEKILPTL